MINMLLILMLHLVIDADVRPNPLDFEKTTLICSNIKALVVREGYKYVGIQYRNTEYISDYKDIDELQKEVNKQCRK